MGDMTAMEGHASTITSLRPGLLRVSAADGMKAYVVTGGFAEISATGVSVLAEQAVPLDELTPAALDALVADACEAAAVNADKDAADKAVADLYAMRAAAASEPGCDHEQQGPGCAGAFAISSGSLAGELARLARVQVSGLE